MKVLHIPQSLNGYEVVTLIAEQVSEKNRLAVITKEGDDTVYMTGGFLLMDTPKVRKTLDAIPKKDLWHTLYELRQRPWCKRKYYEPQQEVNKKELDELLNDKFDELVDQGL